MNLFLQQTTAVQILIENVINSLNFIQDDEAKNKLISSLEPFYYSVVPTTIDVNEIKAMAKEYNISLTHIEALEILDDLCLDIDLNCVEDCMKYHFNEFISEHFQSDDK